MQKSEAELVRGLRGGEPQAFREFAQRYGTRIYDLQCWLCGDRTTAEDLAQETAVAVFRGIGNFKSNSGLYTWIYRIARRTALHHLERKAPCTVSLDEVGDVQAPDDTENQAARSMLRDQIRAALQTLPLGQRESVVLHCLQGLSHSETAEALERPLGTVKWQIAQGLHALRGPMKRLGEDSDEM